MKPLICGNPDIFAIESSITEAFENPGQRALGYFLIEVSGKSYGVRSPAATLLACSFDAVGRRLKRRGSHCLPFNTDLSAAQIVDTVRGAIYDEHRQNDTFFGLSADQFNSVLTANEVIWAPDGDAAFDDGGHVLQFDRGDMVRLIAFRNAADSRVVIESTSEAHLTADEFYHILRSWYHAFETEWRNTLGSSRRN